MKIKYKLMTGIGLLLTLFIIANWAILLLNEKALETKITDKLLIMTDRITLDLEKTIVLRQEFWKTFGYSPTIVRIIEDENDKFSQNKNINEFIAQKDKEWVLAPKEEITPFMKEILDNDLSTLLKARKDYFESEYEYDIYPEVFITNKYGVVIGATDKTTDYNQADEEWWQITKEKGSYLGDLEYDESSKNYAIVNAERIEDSEGNFVGVIKYLVSIDEIIMTFEKMNNNNNNDNNDNDNDNDNDDNGKMGDNSYKGYDLSDENKFNEDNELYADTFFTLINNRQQIIYKTGEGVGLRSLTEYEQEELKELNVNDENEVFTKETDLKDMETELITHRHFKEKGPLKGLNWLLILEFDEEKLFLPINTLKNNSILISMVILLLAFCLTYFVAKSIYQPILNLTRVTEEVEKGNLKLRANTKNKDEIGNLGKSFNHMIKKIEDQKKVLLKKEIEKTKSIKLANLALDEKVKNRTRELENKRNESEKAKSALLNVMQDIEEANAKLKKSYIELKGLDRLKTEFLSFTSHELRTPLTPIRAQLQRMLSKELPPKERKESLEMVLRNTVRLDKLINDVLDISRIESKRLKIFKSKTSIKVIIKNVVNQMETLAKEKGIKIKVDLNKCPSIVSIDENRIEQVLVNLLDNAVKHSATKEILVTGVKKDNKVEICVKDKGQGIPKEEQEHMFEAFHYRGTSKLSPKGAGLGLAICKGIVHAHGGNIWFKTTIGEGTTFCVDLPLE